MRDLSIDIETLSTRNDAALIAIGVQEFDLPTGKMGRTLYRKIVLQSAIKAGAVDGSTLLWWMRQSTEAREEAFGADPREVDKFPLSIALDELCTFCRATKGSVPMMWANGPHFDIVILENAYRNGAIGLLPPWHYNCVRDMRTIVQVATDLRGFDPSTIAFEGTTHHALHDATHQAKVISAAFAALRGTEAAKPAKPAKPAKKATAQAAPEFRYFSHPESDSCVKYRSDEVETMTLDPLLVEISFEAYKKWDSEQEL